MAVSAVLVEGLEGVLDLLLPFVRELWTRVSVSSFLLSGSRGVHSADPL